MARLHEPPPQAPISVLQQVDTGVIYAIGSVKQTNLRECKSIVQVLSVAQCEVEVSNPLKSGCDMNLTKV